MFLIYFIVFKIFLSTFQPSRGHPVTHKGGCASKNWNDEDCKEDRSTQRGWHVGMISDLMFQKHTEEFVTIYHRPCQLDLSR